MPRDERRSASRPTRRRERVVREEPPRSQLFMDSDQPSAPAQYGGPLRRRDDPPDPRQQDTGGEGGYGTPGGGAYYGEGSSHNAPSHGDRARNAAGTDAGDRGRATPDNDGEHTWGESEQDPGPRASRRSDESIHEEVCELLTHHPDVDASGLEVQVEFGEVTLQGSVEDREMRWLAEDLVESVSGVSLVHNRLRVSRR